MALPDFLGGYAYIVGFRDVRPSQVIFLPKADASTKKLILAAAVHLKQNFGDDVLPGDRARISGPYAMDASSTFHDVTANHLRDEEEEEHR